MDVVRDVINGFRSEPSKVKKLKKKKDLKISNVVINTMTRKVNTMGKPVEKNEFMANI